MCIILAKVIDNICQWVHNKPKAQSITALRMSCNSELLNRRFVPINASPSRDTVPWIGRFLKPECLFLFTTVRFSHHLANQLHMAVEGIHAAREAREGHLLRQQTGTSTIKGRGGGEWDDSLWSLSCTESEDQSSETNPPTSGLTRSLPTHTTWVLSLPTMPTGCPALALSPRTCCRYSCQIEVFYEVRRKVSAKVWICIRLQATICQIRWHAAIIYPAKAGRISL